MGDSLHRIFVNDDYTKDGKKPAVIVTEHLAIAHTNQKLDTETFMVYVIATNKPLLNVRIADWNSAVMLAQWIEQVYGVYLDIYSIYPDWDVLAIARLSVPKGETTFEQISNMSGLINLEQMEKAKDRALA
jgi:hypothetical protein